MSDYGDLLKKLVQKRKREENKQEYKQKILDEDKQLQSQGAYPSETYSGKDT